MAIFLLFAAVLGLGATNAEASLPKATDDVALSGVSLHEGVFATHSLPAADLDQDTVAASRFGFAGGLCLLDPERAQTGLTLFVRESCRCEITYARNNPLKFVDRDGRENEVAWDAMNRNQVRETYGDAALSRYDTQRAVMGAAVGGLLAGGVAVAEWGPVALALGQEALSRFGDRASPFIQGNYGQVARAELARAAAAEGPTVEVLTKLTSAPQAGRALSVATGEGANALANAARSAGNLYQAQIPKALLMTLEKAGLALPSATNMGGKAATEYRILPQAAEFIVKYFRQVPSSGQ
ncbi:MAG: hypothetical protein DIJKHBIC_03694 [Thermoanaerobaculia bacterium]|nr:hypothetical protein [Thermoanaerobaculia bacterium]